MNKINKKKLNMYLKVIILLVIALILIKVIQNAFSRYKSEASSEQEIEIAYILLHTQQVTDNILINNLLPGNISGNVTEATLQFDELKPATYEFQVKNTDGTNRSEVNIDYTITLRATTNLPLEYELYKNQNYNDTGATNILGTSSIERDSYGTYFKVSSSGTQNLGHQTDQADTYQLVVKFPATANSYLYSDIAESLQLIIDAREKI